MGDLWFVLMVVAAICGGFAFLGYLVDLIVSLEAEER